MEHKEKFNVWNIPVHIKKGCVCIAATALIGDEESINNGYIGGFSSSGGINLKKKLLEFEKSF